jgi:hypothetical protein
MKKEIMEDVNLIIQSNEDVLFLVVAAAATILIQKETEGSLGHEMLLMLLARENSDTIKP